MDDQTMHHHTLEALGAAVADRSGHQGAAVDVDTHLGALGAAGALWPAISGWVAVLDRFDQAAPGEPHGIVAWDPATGQTVPPEGRVDPDILAAARIVAMLRNGETDSAHAVWLCACQAGHGYATAAMSLGMVAVVLHQAAPGPGRTRPGQPATNTDTKEP